MDGDVLGPEWSVRELPLAPDAEGQVVATLVRLPARRPSGRAVLYVHGFVDYFFQVHLAREWADHGFDFYALDLRKYGRSLRPHQTPNYCTDLREYDEELDRALAVMREDGQRTIVGLAHSTGGLIASLWAHRHRGEGLLDALVLNSPWFEVNGSWFERTIATTVINAVGRRLPRAPVPTQLSSHYGRSLHRSNGGEWDYDLALKPPGGFPILAGWVRAIRRGHRELARGLAIDCPVLVCCSTTSGPHTRWHEQLATTDSVLDVRHIVALADRLGPDVTVRQIPDGVHDLALSGPRARQAFFDAMFDWLRARLPDPPESITSV